MEFYSLIIDMVVVGSVLVSAKRLERNTFADRNKIKHIMDKERLLDVLKSKIEEADAIFVPSNTCMNAKQAKPTPILPNCWKERTITS